jgi:tetratricopeptide (TPR) repeat protein
MKYVSLFLVLSIVSFEAVASFSPKTDVAIYNEGVDLMLALKFKKAEKKFLKALEADADFGEAHNNLAFCIRKQGPARYDLAMQHYNRAIELLPEAPQPYMYRGVLFVSMGDSKSALLDHARLLELGANDLATELEWVITNKKEKEPAQFFGVFREMSEE